MVKSFQFTRSARLILASDRQEAVMGLRPTKTNEGASDRCRGINNLDRAFNRAVLAGLLQTRACFRFLVWNKKVPGACRIGRR